MSPMTHNLTATALAVGVFAVLPVHQAAEFGFGCLLGARAPDWLEIAGYNRMTAHRWSLISHRTLTPWSWLWMMLLILTVPAVLSGSQGALGATGFTVGCLLHIGMDYLTPMGVPLGINPFGERSSLKLVRTGSINEVLVILTAFVLAGVLWSIAAVF